MRRSLIAAVAATALAAPLALAATASAAPRAPIPPRAPATDFDHDGYADLAVSAPQGTVAGKPAGYVSVLYGSPSGPDRAHAQTISRATEGVPGEPEDGGTFGDRTASADLDGDGYTDLVVGSGGRPVTVLWGSEDGLSGRASTELDSKAYRFTTGDFNGDGKLDLVTNDYPDVDDPEGGDDAGMTLSYGPFTRAGKPAHAETVPTSQTFGPVDIVAGDMTGDGIDDVVTSHGFEELAYGSLFWKGARGGVSHTPKSIKSTSGGAIADVDGDGYGDLATRDIGEYGEDDESEKGTVRIEYGGPNGPSGRVKKITQDTAGVPGKGETGDQFGAAVDARDVTGDGLADIAVGVPGEDVGSVRDAGGVVLLKGARGGVTGAGAQAFTQSTAGVPGASEKGDAFGFAVRLSDTNGDKKADLTVAAPLEDGRYADSGAAWVLRGAGGGLTTTGIASFGPAALGAPEKGARLGDELR